jgi:hypothetical protein
MRDWGQFLVLIQSSQCCGDCALDGRGGESWNRIVQADNPQPRSASLNRTYSSDRIVSPTPSATRRRMPSGEVISSTTWVLICVSTIFRGQ